VVVVAFNCCCGFLEADVVEASKGSAADVFDRVVRDQKLLLKRGERHEKEQKQQVKGKHTKLIKPVVPSESQVASYLPPHENIVRVLQILIVKLVRVERLCVLVEGVELALDVTSKEIM